MTFTAHTKKGLNNYSLDSNLPDDCISMHVSELPPGKSSHEPHTHDGVESYYVFHGELTISLNGEPLKLAPKRSGVDRFEQAAQSDQYRQRPEQVHGDNRQAESDFVGRRRVPCPRRLFWRGHVVAGMPTHYCRVGMAPADHSWNSRHNSSRI